MYKDDDKESKEPNHNEDKSQLEEKQEEEIGEQETTNQVLDSMPFKSRIR
jgi:hypothetical protein